MIVIIIALVFIAAIVVSLILTVTEKSLPWLVALLLIIGFTLPHIMAAFK
jgi:ABC-type lipoprotein release transport system permease subunit